MKNKYMKQIMLMLSIVAMSSQMLALVIPDADIDAANAKLIALSKRRNDAMRELERENPKEGESKHDPAKTAGLDAAQLQAKLDEVKSASAEVATLPLAEEVSADKGDPKGMVSRQKQRYIASLRATIHSLKLDEEFLTDIMSKKSTAPAPAAPIRYLPLPPQQDTIAAELPAMQKAARVLLDDKHMTQARYDALVELYGRLKRYDMLSDYVQHSKAVRELQNEVYTELNRVQDGMPDLDRAVLVPPLPERDVPAPAADEQDEVISEEFKRLEASAKSLLDNKQVSEARKQELEGLWKEIDDLYVLVKAYVLEKPAARAWKPVVKLLRQTVLSEITRVKLELEAQAALKAGKPEPVVPETKFEEEYKKEGQALLEQIKAAPPIEQKPAGEEKSLLEQIKEVKLTRPVERKPSEAAKASAKKPGLFDSFKAKIQQIRKAVIGDDSEDSWD